MITSVQTNKPMNDFLTEIQDAPGEIFDIPEMQDLFNEKSLTLKNILTETLTIDFRW